MAQPSPLGGESRFRKGTTRTTRTVTFVWAEAARHYDERSLALLVLAIAVINVWNRLNVSTRQVAGE